MRSEAVKTRTSIFYGWFLVAAAFTVTMLGFGSAYTFSAFLEPLQEEFGASRGAVSTVFSLAGFLYFGFGIVSGPLADRWGARRLAIVGMTLISAGMAVSAAARSLTDIYLAYTIGLGLGLGCAYVPVIAALQRWFVRRRGLASGLALSGIGVGTLVLPPVASVLIGRFEWRGAYLILAVLVVVAGVGMAFLIKDSPSELGLSSDGAPSETTRHNAPKADATVKEAVESRQFIGLYAACLFCSFGAFIPFVHLVPFAVDHGIERSSAVLLVGAIGVGSTLGRFVLGGLADRLGRGRALLGMFVGMALTMSLWAVSINFAALLAFALAYGAFYGGWVAILPAVVMDYFGGRRVSSIIGALYTSVAIGTLIGPSFAGFAFDIYASYLLPISMSACANIIAVLIMLPIVRNVDSSDLVLKK